MWLTTYNNDTHTHTHTNANNNNKKCNNNEYWNMWLVCLHIFYSYHGGIKRLFDSDNLCVMCIVDSVLFCCSHVQWIYHQSFRRVFFFCMLRARRSMIALCMCYRRVAHTRTRRLQRPRMSNNKIGRQWGLLALSPVLLLHFNQLHFGGRMHRIKQKYR